MRRAAAVAVAAALALLPTAAAAAAPVDVDVRVLVPRSDERTVSLVAEVPGSAAAPATAEIAAGEVAVAGRVQSYLAGSASVVLVVDSSAAGASTLADGGQSGGAGLLLQLPPEVRTGVVADRSPPVLAAPPEAGVAEDLPALSELTASGERDTPAAVRLALSRLPSDGTPATIVLWTSGGDTGAEPAEAAADRLRAANTVLSVVTPAGVDGGYWADVAERTGGVAVANAEGQPAVRAFDRVADALRSRYLVTFDRLADGGAAELRFARQGSAPVVVPFELPDAQAAPVPTQAAPAAPPAAASSGDGPNPLVAGAIAVGVIAVLLAIVVLVLARLQRPVSAPVAAAPPPGPGPAPADDAKPQVVTLPEARPAQPAGLRVFDIRDGEPREIHENLFEPRSVRDARDREERAKQDRER